MNYEQKFEALQSLGDVSLRMRKPGDWYVDHRGVEILEGNLLCSPCSKGLNPVLAVESYWKLLTDLKDTESIVIHAFDVSKRRAVKWNGYMWKDVKESW